jgi:hypothetical protein
MVVLVLERRRGSVLVLICALVVVFIQLPNLSKISPSYLSNDELSAFFDNPVVISDASPPNGTSTSASTSTGSVFPVTFINDTTSTLLPLPVEPPPGTRAKGLEAWSVELKTPYLDLISSSLHVYPSGHFQATGRSFARAYEHQPSSKFCRFQTPVRIGKRRQKDKDQDPNVPSFVYWPLEGLFYNKVPKAASSTLAGINHRIALRHAERVRKDNNNNSNSNNNVPGVVNIPATNSSSCTHAESHILGARRYYGNRHTKKSFLWGSIRDPASRALSRIFFFQISKVGRPSDDETILLFLKNNVNPQSGTISAGKGGFQTQYLAMDYAMNDWFSYSKSYPTIVQRPDVLHDRVRTIIRDYDFLAVTERMDESLVALQLLLGLSVADILTASSSKRGGAYTEQIHKNGTVQCIAIRPTFRSPAVREYLTSEEWYAVNYADYVLYAAANHSLDLTIHSLGNERFDKALLEYRHAKAIIDERCQNRIFSPCSANGTAQLKLSKQNCYKYDEGCGYPCIDEVSLEHGW